MISLTPVQARALSRLQLVAFDVDGVLTNGQLFYSAEGETLKAFHVRDGVGLKLLQDMGIGVAVISAKRSAMVAARMRDLGIQHYYPGTKDKRQCLLTLAAELSLDPAVCAFVGDDMVDLPAMDWCGVAMAPADAYSAVLAQALWVSPLAGGQGVARSVADAILTAKGVLEQAYRQTTQVHFERDR
ncbi:MAG: KdsC family phosphatase [Saccharospirillum sp.]